MDTNLYKLQELEREVEKIKKNEDGQALKRDLIDEKKEITNKINDFKLKKEEATNLKKELKRIEGDLEGIKSDIKENEKVLYDGDITNYKEIQDLKDRAAEFNEKKLDIEDDEYYLVEKIEALEEELATEKSEIIKRKDEYNQALETLKKRDVEISKEAEKKEKEVKAYRKKFKSEDLEHYDAMQERFPLTGVAVIMENKICSSCRINVSVVKLKEVNKDKITYCDNCSRLIVGNFEDIE